LTPSDIAPAKLSQQQIDELHQRYEIADVLPLTHDSLALSLGVRRATVTEELGHLQKNIEHVNQIVLASFMTVTWRELVG